MPGEVDLSTITLETLVAAIALVVTIAVWLVDRYFLRRRRLVYRVQVDAAIAVTPGDTEHMDVEVRYRGKVVPDPHVVLIRIDNAGGLDIEPRHIQKKLEFAFPDRKIVGLDVTGASPASLGQILEERLASDNFIETSLGSRPMRQS